MRRSSGWCTRGSRSRGREWAQGHAMVRGQLWAGWAVWWDLVGDACACVARRLALSMLVHCALAVRLCGKVLLVYATSMCVSGGTSAFCDPANGAAVLHACWSRFVYTSVPRCAGSHVSP